MSAYAEITADKINDDDKDSRKGWSFGDNTLSAAAVKHSFKLVDDDGIVYYVGYILATSEDEADELAEDLWNWGAYDAGTVAIIIDGESVFG